jgi:hypothetical protein
VGASTCETTWNLLAIGRLFQCPTSVGDSNFLKLSAADLNVFPYYTECRPVVTIDDTLVGSKLALATNGQDPLLVYPEVLSLFPYAFTSNIPPVSREVQRSMDRRRSCCPYCAATTALVVCVR